MTIRMSCSIKLQIKVVLRRRLFSRNKEKKVSDPKTRPVCDSGWVWPPRRYDTLPVNNEGAVPVQQQQNRIVCPKHILQQKQQTQQM
jgi:hypothetical protein